MKKLTLAQILCALSVSIAGSATAGSIGASFLGRNDTTSLAPTDSAGLVEQAFWNNIDDAAKGESGTSGSLVDDAGNLTATTVSFKGNDSWNSNGPHDTANDRLMLGIIKQQGKGSTGTFSVNNLGAGPYDVILYIGMDADGVSADMSVNGVVQSVIQTHQFGGTFINATATDAGNYVRFNGVTPAAGKINIGMKYLDGGNGAGLAGIQVLGGSFAVNATPASIVTQPKSATVSTGSAAGFTVVADNVNDHIQWYRGTALLPGATAATYAISVTTAGDNGAKFHATVANNVNTVISDEVSLTVLTPVLANGFLTADFFTGIGGTSVANLTDNAKYQAGVADQTLFLSAFDTPNGYGDNYGCRVSGFLIPKVSGNYTFFIRSDDASSLYLSTDETTANLSTDPICFEGGCCKGFQEPGTDQTSASSIPLLAGKKYAIRGFLKEGGGGDYLQVAMREDNDTTATGDLKPIGGDQLATFALPDGVITVASDPVSVEVEAGTAATFTVAASAKNPRQNLAVAYQWKKGTALLAGENNATLKIASPQVVDSGSTYSVVLTAPGAPTQTSAAVTLTVHADVTAPQVVSVGGVATRAGDIEVGVVFGEPVTTATASDKSNYTLSVGSVTAVRLIGNGSGLKSREQSVVLSTTGLSKGAAASLTVKNIADLAGNIRPANSPATAFKVSKFSWADLSDPANFNGAKSDWVLDVVATAENGFNVINGGNGYWNNHDDATFVYEEITGDFDKVGRVIDQDPSSQWARAGIAARESLDSQNELASRYQQVHANPYPKFATGADSNQGFETNRRLATGGGTSSSNGDNGPNHPQYPNAWLRLRRAGDVISMYRSNDGITWFSMGRTDFNPADGTGAPLSAKMFVGLAFGSENGNDPENVRNSWNARFRDYGDFKSTDVAGKQTYGIGVNFTDDSRDGSVGPNDIAGTTQTAQAHWNNAFGRNSDAGILPLKADEGGVEKTTTATVEWVGSGNTWASTGRGEENNLLTAGNHLLMSGFLDTSGDSLTQVKFTGLGTKLTAGKGYDVIVYALGGVASGRGGAYRVTDENGVALKPYVLTLSDLNPTELHRVPVADNATPGDGSTYGQGSYILFEGLHGANVIVEGTTQTVDPLDSSTPDLGVGSPNRAPINAVQLVPSGLFTVVTVTPTISISGNVITFVGKLLSSDTVNGAYTEVSGATSPKTITATSGNKFFRAGN